MNELDGGRVQQDNLNYSKLEAKSMHGISPENTHIALERRGTMTK